MSLPLIALSSLFALAYGQQIGTNTAEVNPPLIWETCTGVGNCTPVNGSVTIDANYRWTHQVGGYTNCKTASGTWNTTICPDPITCAENCAVEGVDYTTSGVATSGNALTVTLTTATNSGPRVYLLDPTGEKYQLFQLLQKEFTFDVNLSQVGCGMNAALYFSEMNVDGGKATTNVAGPKYGTGYCDAQCPSGDNFIDGQANFANTAQCCTEMDIWEANAISNAFTTHGCLQDGPYACPSTGCSGQCDGNGCAFNAYGMGAKTFYGPGETVDTGSKFTVVTQFITDNGLPSGNLAQIRRIYVQNGVVIQNAMSQVSGIQSTNAISTAFCDQQLGTTSPFEAVGGMKPLTTAFTTGMVLAVSLWDDSSPDGMSWLDGAPNAGTCTTGVNTTAATVNATFSNIRFGDINSTYVMPPPISTSIITLSPPHTTTTPTSTKPTTTSTTTVPTQTHWGQCAGIGYT
ncbi:hypothetical protein FRB97_007705 [Tulasnella sp. 331]|nr:hypothetical protein FRB97_007705 [Tulasnella sp. 331]KAG8875573.1 hypothetical protein FRB98_007734 [Tulasnella sp. 332]